MKQLGLQFSLAFDVRVHAYIGGDPRLYTMIYITARGTAQWRYKTSFMTLQGGELYHHRCIARFFYEFSNLFLVFHGSACQFISSSRTRTVL